MWIRALVLGGSAAALCLHAAVAAEKPAEQVTAASEKAVPDEATEQLTLDKLMVLARKQGFTVVDKHGTKYLCRTSETVGSRLNRKVECYTPDQWKQMTADTQDDFRENTRKQVNKSGG